ncbi:MAG: M23 family metallopeptidase [Gemmatimonadota bacterium]
MTKRRWTIIVVPEGSSTSRAIEVSHTAVKLGTSAGLAAVVIALMLGYGTVSKSLNVARAGRLEQENQHLAHELGVLHAEMSELADTMVSLEKQDGKIRLLANLEPIDPQVRAVGIGGPWTAADEAPSGVLLSRAGEIRVDLKALIRRANLLSGSFRAAADSFRSHTERLAATPSIMPTQGWLTSQFSQGRMHPILHRSRAHEGIDVSAPLGSSIEAPANGRVIEAGWTTGYGNMVVIAHGFGLVTKYGHTSRILVRVGQKVKRGESIALVGSTGLSTSPHLHYEVHVNGVAVDPLRFVLPAVVAD